MLSVASEKHWGVQRTSLLNNCIWDVFPQCSHTAFQALLINAKAGNSIISDVMCPVTQHWLHLSASPYNDGLVVIFYDIQNEKQAEQKINEQAHFIQGTNDALADILSIMEIESKKIIYTNHSISQGVGLYRPFYKHNGKSFF